MDLSIGWLGQTQYPHPSLYLHWQSIDKFHCYSLHALCSYLSILYIVIYSYQLEVQMLYLTMPWGYQKPRKK